MPPRLLREPVAGRRHLADAAPEWKARHFRPDGSGEPVSGILERERHRRRDPGEESVPEPGDRVLFVQDGGHPEGSCCEVGSCTASVAAARASPGAGEPVGRNSQVRPVTGFGASESRLIA